MSDGGRVYGGVALWVSEIRRSRVLIVFGGMEEEEDMLMMGMRN
jgi:hypothetical protein